MTAVLIVEDEFAIADLLEMVLIDEGHCVLVAVNGRQGLDRLAEEPRPDLVISDYMWLMQERQADSDRRTPATIQFL